MTLHHDHRTGLRLAGPTTRADLPVVDTKPPTRSKVTAALAAIACAACCALPLLIAAGVLTGAGAGIAQNLLVAASGVLVAAAGAMWWLHRRRSVQEAAAAGRSGCDDSICGC